MLTLKHILSDNTRIATIGRGLPFGSRLHFSLLIGIYPQPVGRLTPRSPSVYGQPDAHHRRTNFEHGDHDRQFIEYLTGQLCCRYAADM